MREGVDETQLTSDDAPQSDGGCGRNLAPLQRGSTAQVRACTREVVDTWEAPRHEGRRG